MNKTRPIFIPGILTDEQLGHYLIDHGWKSFPDGMLPFLDYSAIGADHRETFKGVFTADGYRCSGLAMPDPNAPFVVFVTADGLTHDDNFFIQMPMAEKRLTEIAQRHGLTIDELTPYRVECRVHGIQEFLPEEIPTLSEINDFALAVSDCERFDGSLNLLRAACIAERPETWHTLNNIVQNLDFYELIPDNPERYVRKVLESDFRYQRGIYVLKELDDYIDYAACAKALMKKDGVRRTEFGLVRKKYGLLPPGLPGEITWQY